MLSFSLAILFLQGTVPVHPAPNAVVATVDGAPITVAEVDPYVWERYSRSVIDELVGHRIIAEEAKRKGIAATDAEVKARIDQQLASIAPNVPAGRTIEEFIKSPDIGGMSRLALVARSSVLLEKIAAAEFKPGGFVKVATLVFPTTGDTTDALSKAIKSADSAYAALQGGKSWEAVLRQYEKNDAVIKSGGLIGWKAIEVFPDSVQAQFKLLKPLGYTKPTQTNNGIQIFRLMARGATATPADLGDLKTQYVQGSLKAVMARLRAAAKVEVK